MIEPDRNTTEIRLRLLAAVVTHLPPA